MARETSDDGPLLLSNLPPTKRQIRLALGILLALLGAFLVLTLFANIHLSEIGPFITVTLALIMVNDLITSSLLLSQFFVVGRTSLFVLAISYLFSGFTMIPLMLIFPGAFSATGLLGAGLQSAIYLQFFYRVVTPLAVIAYALLRDAGSTTSMVGRWPSAAIICSVVVVVAVVCGLTWFVTAEGRLLPTIFIDRLHANRLPLLVINAVLLSSNAFALALLWARRRSVLDLWLMVMCCVWFLFHTMSGIISPDRFSVGWYGARCYEVIATMVVLLALLSEATALYARLGRSLVTERHAREVRQLAMDAMAAAIAHEIRQPLAAIATNGSAGLRWMAKPDLDEVRAALERIVSNAHRATEVIEGIRSLFKKGIQGRSWLEVNEIIREVLTRADDDLRAQRISVSTDLHQSIPRLFASRAQLEEVFLNLIMNAIEAMHLVTGRARMLRISSDIVQESSAIIVTIEDTGTGIDRELSERIFQPFFTTKSQGTGIGLVICRAIVESHGGTLRASANTPYGTIFHVELPSGQSGLQRELDHREAPPRALNQRSPA